jgi:endonuclease YncB( thermonuclease family)
METFLGILIFGVLFALLSGRRLVGKRSRSRRAQASRQRKKLKAKIRPVSFEPFSGTAHVIDGDTIKVRGRKVRLAGINAPELNMPYGQQAKWAMVDICKGKIVRVVPNGETSFDRIVATCYVDGDLDIGAELIRRGLARDIPVFTGGKYTHLETQAARVRIKPTPYRKANRPLNQKLVDEVEDDEIILIDNDDE